MSPTPPMVSRAVSADKEKRLAAEAAAELVEDGMCVGLGTGSTVAFLLPALAARALSDVPRSPDGGVIADYTGDFDDPEELAARPSATAGVVEHGFFPPALVSDVVVARSEGVEIRAVS